ncbi:hypothetical protein ScPMuIL_012777 [Solemya velum]
MPKVRRTKVSYKYSIEEKTSRQKLIMDMNNSGGKTSMLFQAALSYSAEDLHVMFICSKPWVRMPLCVHGMPRPDSSILRLLKFQYMDTVGELLDCCASLHMKTLPDVIIIDDLNYYISQMKGHGVEKGTAKLCAILLDTVAHVKKASDNHQCHLLMSAGDNAKFLHAACRHFHMNIVCIQESEIHTGIYTMNLHSWPRETSVNLQYQLKDSGIFLDTVMFHKQTVSDGMDRSDTLRDNPD